MRVRLARRGVVGDRGRGVGAGAVGLGPSEDGQAFAALGARLVVRVVDGHRGLHRRWVQPPGGPHLREVAGSVAIEDDLWKKKENGGGLK